MPVLRSAKRLFDERRVKRVMLEFMPFRWPAQQGGQREGYTHLAKLFTGWQCEVMCPNSEHDGVRFEFSRDNVLRHISGTRNGTRFTCENLYCVDRRSDIEWIESHVDRSFSRR